MRNDLNHQFSRECNEQQRSESGGHPCEPATSATGFDTASGYFSVAIHHGEKLQERLPVSGKFP